MLMRRIGNVEDYVHDMYINEVNTRPTGSDVYGQAYGLPAKVIKGFDGKHATGVHITMGLREPWTFERIFDEAPGGLQGACSRVLEHYDGQVCLDRGGAGSLIASPSRWATIADAVGVVIQACKLIPMPVEAIQWVSVDAIVDPVVHSLLFKSNTRPVEQVLQELVATFNKDATTWDSDRIYALYGSWVDAGGLRHASEPDARALSNALMARALP